MSALDELRLGSRLAAAHRLPIAAMPLRHFKRAFDAMREGEAALAYTHLALSGLNKLVDPNEDARWLFIVDALLAEGADPLTILKGLGTDPRDCGISLEKYDPDQPRVPSGNPDGGRWTHDDAVTLSDRQHSHELVDDLGLVLPHGCEEEWRQARKFGQRLLSTPNPPLGLTGGHTTVDGCAKGFVSQRCGGNPVA
ncbi:MAG TPA: hypothetical protein VGH40_18460 [Roseiarcus sp.]